MRTTLAPVWVLCMIACLVSCAASARAPAMPTPRQMMELNGLASVRVVQPGLRGPGGNHSGTGAVVDIRGYVVTNYHIIDPRPRPDLGIEEGSGTYVICEAYPGKSACSRAELVGTDPSHDLALLKTETLAFGNAVDFADDLEALLGDEVYLWGHVGNLAPLSPLFGRLVNWVTAERYGSPRLVTGPAPEHVVDFPLLLLDVPMNPGSSGGPVFLADGRCIGIAFASTRTSPGSNAFALAAPSRHVIALVKKHVPAP